MRVELLAFDGCPNVRSTLALLREALRLESVDAAIQVIDVDTAGAAQRLRFLGSPTVRIDGEDVEPEAMKRTAYAIMCRTYGSGDASAGMPSIDALRSAIRRHRDILRSLPVLALVFVLPIVALNISANVRVGLGWQTAVWAASFTTMGIGCVVNALRCGRVHCYLTGPFFLAIAVLTILYGLRIAHLGPHGWSVISLVALAGGALLCCFSEALLGKYRWSYR